MQGYIDDMSNGKTLPLINANERELWRRIWLKHVDNYSLSSAPTTPDWAHACPTTGSICPSTSDLEQGKYQSCQALLLFHI